MKYKINKNDDLQDRLRCLLNIPLWGRLGHRLNRFGSRIGIPLYNQLRNRLRNRLGNYEV
jgi:hypothetical protein